MLQFVPFSSCMDSNFWHKLSHIKLNEYGLDDSLVNIKGYYCNYLPDKLSVFMNVDYDSFDCQSPVPNKCFKALGCLKINNTFEDFVTSDKKASITNEGKKIWNDILRGEALSDPSLLMRFLLLTYADLKKFTFHYWCAFPALSVKERFSILSGPSLLGDRFNKEKISLLLGSYDIFSKKHNFPCMFLVRNIETHPEVRGLCKFGEWKDSGDEIIVAFADPGTSPSHPGWPLRNILICISHCWFKDLGGQVKLVCFRDRTKDGVRSISHSLFIHIKLIDLTQQIECPDVVGWEKDDTNALGPRRIDLSSQMDPLKLCEASVDLNLKLMKWRLLPDLNLDEISSSKFLLLGSGTLGCNVARGLMGWGARHITLVDNSRISYSNPIRQSLFTYQDCLHGGKHKAQAAAEALKLIFPQVNAVGIHLSIPMPGHNVANSVMDKVKKDVETLTELIESHDVIFLLMDTRESRWLPTLIGKFMSKIVISASLGFGTFLVIRHGVGCPSEELPTEGTKTIPNVIPGNNLGCYFCNDVTSPGNSTTDRTLDQQCTVTRPGVSMIASACSVELAISILHHPLRGQASASTRTSDGLCADESILGSVPHQIRGFLASFTNISTATIGFDKCTACSAKVLEAYKKEGFDFLFRVFNSPATLEDITGLTLLNMEAVNMSVLDFSDAEDDIEETS